MWTLFEQEKCKIYISSPWSIIFGPFCLCVPGLIGAPGPLKVQRYLQSVTIGFPGFFLLMTNSWSMLASWSLWTWSWNWKAKTPYSLLLLTLRWPLISGLLMRGTQWSQLITMFCKSFLYVLQKTKRVNIQKEFTQWLQSCHEKLDKQVKFLGYIETITRTDLLTKRQQHPWATFSSIELDGKTYKAGLLVRSSFFYNIPVHVF